LSYIGTDWTETEGGIEATTARSGCAIWDGSSEPHRSFNSSSATPIRGAGRPRTALSPLPPTRLASRRARASESSR